MKHRIIDLATNRPGRVYIFTAVLSVIAAAALLRITIDTDPENMLPSEQSDRLFHNEVEQTFGLHDAIVVGVVNDQDPNGIYNPVSLANVLELSQRIIQLDGVVSQDLMSLAVADNITQTEIGELRFEWMMRDAPTTQEQSDAIREAVRRLPLLNDTLVSSDGRAAAIYVPIQSKDQSYRLATEIEEITSELSGNDDFHVTGLPVAEDTFGVEMFVQMGISAPLAALMIFLLMWYFFRSAVLVASPMLVAMATVIITMGALIGLGFTVHIMSSMIPIFLMPIAVVDSVHIMSEFADRYKAGDDQREVISDVVEHLYKPMLFTSVTTAIGFASLLLTPIPPVQIFGAFVAFGVLLAFAITLTLIPAYVVRMRPEQLAALAKLKSGKVTETPLARVLRRIGEFAFKRGRLIVGVTGLFLAVSLAGISRIEINDNPVRWFKESHRIRVADTVLNEHFAGTYDAFVVLQFDASDPLKAFVAEANTTIDNLRANDNDVADMQDMLAAIEREEYSALGDLIAAVDDALFDADSQSEDLYISLLSKAEAAQSASRYFQSPEALRVVEDIQSALIASGLVGKTNGLPDVVKVVNRELRSGTDSDYLIPASTPGVAQTLLQYQSSHRPQDLWHMVTPDYQRTTIWLQLTSGDNQDMTKVIAGLDEYINTHPLPPGVSYGWAGKTFINVVWQSEMVAGMLKSLLGAFVIVFLMMAVLFRSALFGLLAMVPLTVTILGVYGFIGWIGKDYDMPIAVLSSLTLGLSVDFAIHFIQRFRDMSASAKSVGEARALMFEEPARAIARNAIVIALGFTPLFFAPLVPYITVGAFMASIMVISGFSTLMLLPAVFSFLKPTTFGVSHAERI